MNECNSTQAAQRRFNRRLLLFVISLAAGIAVGLIGYHLSGSQTWFLAIPGVLALVWLFVANPSECCDAESQRPGNGVGKRRDV